jgi:CGNR zinc finger/Putative stress-induced transcription regulator
VEFVGYVDGAVELVNADFDSLDDVTSYLGPRPWLAPRVKPGDLRMMKKLQAELSAIVDASAAGDGQLVVRLINEALERYPVTAALSDHDGQPWHLHVGDSHRSVPEVLGAEALFGLAVLVSELGTDRLGRCEAPSCAGAFVDTSPNHTRRYCCMRCATRTNVAAHRRRNKGTTAAGEAGPAAAQESQNP